MDPNPGLFSGQFPTIPHKPLHVNAGNPNIFRDVFLPERDLTGSVDLSQGGIATDLGGNQFGLLQDVTYQ